MNRLKELRLKKGLNQKEIANELNIEYQNYNKYELNKNEPNIATLIKLANYYDVSLDFLVGRPRPFDFPIIASETQKALINHILMLDDTLCEKIDAYAYGLDDGKKAQQNTKNSL